jgi:hypothetical protein
MELHFAGFNTSLMDVSANVSSDDLLGCVCNFMEYWALIITKYETFIILPTFFAWDYVLSCFNQCPTALPQSENQLLRVCLRIA